MEVVDRSRKPTAARAPHSKNRSGCITCKTRHVKCDERKPTCLKCEKAGRTCAGYETPQQLALSRAKPTKGFRAFKEIIVVDPARELTPNYNFTFAESHAFDHFLKRTVLALQQQSQNASWILPVLHLQQSNETLRQCCIALGSLHEHYAAHGLDHLYSSPPLTLGPEATLANKGYMAALRSLSAGIAKGTLSVDTVRMACVLLTVYESMRGNINGMRVHLRTGLSLMSRTLEKPPEDSENPIESVVWRLGYLYALYARPITIGSPEIKLIQTPDFDIDFKVPTDFASSRTALAHLLPVVINYTKKGVESLFETEMDALSARFKVENALLRYGTAVNNLLQRSEVPTEKLTYKKWLATYELCLIFVRGFDQITQTHFDTMTDRFERMVGYLESTQQLEENVSDPGMKTFSFDFGIIPTLYFAGTHCREPVIRRRVLKMLKEVPRREGAWDADVCAKCLEAMIEFEEREFSEPPVGNPGAIPENRRAHIMNVEDCDSAGPLGKRVTFYWHLKDSVKDSVSWFRRPTREDYQYHWTFTI